MASKRDAAVCLDKARRRHATSLSALNFAHCIRHVWPSEVSRSEALNSDQNHIVLKSQPLKLQCSPITVTTMGIWPKCHWEQKLLLHSLRTSLLHEGVIGDSGKCHINHRKMSTVTMNRCNSELRSPVHYSPLIRSTPFCPRKIDWPYRQADLISGLLTA